MIREFLNINRGDSGAAPHKPLMLLCLMELMDQGMVTENRFEPDDKLVYIFKNLSAQLVGKKKTPVTHHLPFFHLQSDGFWNLSLKYGKQIRLTNKKSPSGWSSITQAVTHGSLTEEIFIKLRDPEIRAATKRLLLLTYFPATFQQSDLLIEQAKEELINLEKEFFSFKVADREPVYNLIKRIERDGYFQTKLPSFYNYSCAISGSRTKVLDKYALVDSCHIIPLKVKSINSINNGITLSPTLHRAFDNFLISIDEEFKVIVSTKIEESAGSSFHLRQFEGKPILLPSKKEWYPSQEALEWHRSQLL